MGTLFYYDDFCQYLSFVEQAARGRLVFRNKFDVRPHEPLLVNLEWGAAGLLAALARGEPALGMHLLRLVALAGLVAGAARALRLAGAEPRRVLWGLVLFVTGAGAGWIALAAGRVDWALDVVYGIFPAQQAITNAHFLAGTALLLWAVVLHVEWRAGSRRAWPWIATASVLGLSRPFDLGTFVLVAGALAARDAGRDGLRAAVRRGLAFAWLVPVLAYNAAVLGSHPSFGLWSGPQNAIGRPPLPGLLLGLGPALALAGLAVARSRAATGIAREMRDALAAWIVVVAALVAVARPSYMLQAVVTVGAALLLVIGAWLPFRALVVATPALAVTSAVVLWIAMNPRSPMLLSLNGYGAFIPRVWHAAVGHLDVACREGDIVMAPPAVGMAVAAATPCTVVVGHRVLTPDIRARVHEAMLFYDPATPMEERMAYLRRVGARHVVLPATLIGPAGPPAGWEKGFDGTAVQVWRRRD